MSHVDSGALHAYLDGALEEYPPAEARRVREHIDVCHECAERLEIERRIRSDAHATLVMAAPTADAPSLEELKSYARRTRKTRSRSRSAAARLTWAASIILAVGVGWMMRADDVGLVSELVTSVPVPIAEPETLVDSSGGPRERNSRDVSNPSIVAESSIGRGRLSVESDAERAMMGVTDQEMNRSAQSVVAQSGEGLEVTNISLDLILDAPPFLGTDRRIAVYDRVAEWDPLETLVALEIEEESEVFPEQRRASSRTVLTSQFALGRGSVRVVPEDDDRFEDEPLQSVPGFEVTGTENVGDGREFIGTVTTQRLEGDYSMQVILLEPGVKLDVLPPLDTSLNEVRVHGETGWVILRGPRSGEELETLLMRLFPG